MKTSYASKIEIKLPKDVVEAAESIKTPRLKMDQKIRRALAIDLFTQREITLAKAARLSGVSRYQFMQLLKDRGIPAYEYTEKEYQKDKKAIAKYAKS